MTQYTTPYTAEDGSGISWWSNKRFQKDAPCKALDFAEEEEGDAVASATDDDKAASALYKQISEMFSRRSNNFLSIEAARMPPWVPFRVRGAALIKKQMVDMAPFFPYNTGITEACARV